VVVLQLKPLIFIKQVAEWQRSRGRKGLGVGGDRRRHDTSRCRNLTFILQLIHWTEASCHSSHPLNDDKAQTPQSWWHSTVRHDISD